MLNLKRFQYGFAAAVVPYLIIGGTAILTSAATGLMSNTGSKVTGVYLNDGSTSPPPVTNLMDQTVGGTYIHLDTSIPLPLSIAESSAGWTSTGTTLTAPPVGNKHYNPGSYSFSASTLCNIPVGSVVTDSTGQYAYTGGGAYPDSTVPTLFTSDTVSAWTNTGSTCNNFQGVPQYRTYIMSSPCGSGYAYNTSTKICALSDSSKAVKPSDGVCKILRSGNSFVANPKDPDCSDPNITPYFTGSNGTFNIVDSNNPRRGAIVAIDSSSRITVTSQTPNTDSSTNTTHTVVAAPATSNGGIAAINVIGAQTTTTTGAGVLTSVASNSTGSTPAIDFPKDYARQSDVMSTTSAVNSVKASIDSLNTPPSEPFDQTKITTFTGKLSEAVTTLTNNAADLPKNILSYSLPLTLNVIACTPYTDFKLLGRTIVIDYCRFIELARAAFGILLYLLTPFVLYSIFLGAMGVYVSRTDDNPKN